MIDLYDLQLIGGTLVAVAVIWLLFLVATRFKVRKKPSLVENVNLARNADFTVSYYSSSREGWYGSFKDDKDSLEKRGIIANLGKDDVKEKDKLRVIVQGMENGIWLAKAYFIKDCPKDIIIATFKDKKGKWHCSYLNEKGIAMAGYILHSPQMLITDLVAGRAYSAHRCNENYFEIE